MSNDVVIYFTNGRMVKLPKDKIKYAHLGSRVDEEYSPDTENNVATVNWDNVAFVRNWIEPEEDDD